MGPGPQKSSEGQRGADHKEAACSEAATRQPAVKASEPAKPQSTSGLYGGLRKVVICIPTQVVCPYCGNYIVTVATPVPGLLSWIVCSSIIVLACFLGCCFLPCCKSSCMEVSHSCPVCDKEIFRCQRV
ncbi:lITAF domain-containing protein [Perognathus longimembris pacificus]|uniref:lITAF domain-containing protein n=1 Tax=Perognathus longimembris pacificus TaxID=214514 RepID=UPI00201903D5|nr:lITAF domain-containing protein [Perognathus longimembris pacificus]